MPNLKELLVDLITAGVKVVNTSREALAKELHEIADEIDGGALIPDAALKKGQATLKKTEDAYGDLPPG